MTQEEYFDMYDRVLNTIENLQSHEEAIALCAELEAYIANGYSFHKRDTRSKRRSHRAPQHTHERSQANG